MKYYLTIFILVSITAHSQSKAMLNTSLESVFQTFFNSAEPGGAVLIVKDGKVIYQKGFGVADISTHEPISTKTLFNIGSISKTFVAYGILKLAQQGKLLLDDPLYNYFPDFKNRAIAEKVKLYHLLTHTSGIPDNRKVDQQKEFYLTAKDEENFAPLKQTDTLEFEPGTKYKYSNPAFNGLALIIEKLTGQKWQDYISKLIFKTAGMTNSTITDGPHPTSAVSHAYVLNDKKEFAELDYGEEPTFADAGNGGVWSSVEELWKYEQAIQQHLFLDSNWIKKSRALYPFPAWKDQQASGLGLSWFLTKEQELDLIGHTGSQGGFISDYLWVPEKNFFYVLLCNIPKPIRDIRSKIFQVLKNNKLL